MRIRVISTQHASYNAAHYTVPIAVQCNLRVYDTNVKVLHAGNVAIVTMMSGGSSKVQPSSRQVPQPPKRLSTLCIPTDRP